MTRTGLRNWTVGILLTGAIALSHASQSLAAEESQEGIDFFEKKIRPVLVEHCYSCHSEKSRRVRGGLLLDTREALRKGGDTGPSIVPGHPKKSLLVEAMRQEGDLWMPPRKKLPDAVIADFEKWVKMGAPDPRKSSKSLTPRKKFAITEADRNHWAFQPVAKVTPPDVKDEQWCQSPIDRFILAQLEAKNLRPSERADRFTLIRRATFDLTGLPPTPKQIEDFIADDSPKAFEKVVDRLLASRAFAERWTRRWLDGVRYASDIDKSGTFRDWVIRAFDQDLPYDQFVRMQLAGDLLPARTTDPAKIHVSGASLDGVAATGMLALAHWEKVARDLAVAEIVDGQIDVVSRQFLGLTMACCRCHDHKFDPLSNKDYYAFAGIFFSSHVTPGKLYSDARLTHDVLEVALLSKADAAKNAKIEAKIGSLRKSIAALEKKAGKAARLAKMRRLIRSIESKVKKARGNAKKKLQKDANKMRSAEKKLVEDQKKNGWELNPAELNEINDLRKQISGLQKQIITPRKAIATKEKGVPGSKRAKIADAPIYIRGDHRKEGEIVPRRFPTILGGDDQEPISKRTDGSGRLELANWIASEDNPLTARVMANRNWQFLFREGIVRTPSNFGNLGERPTHPKLLDYITRRFIESGWSVKKLVRELMLTSTYQQSSFADPALLKVDPENKLFGRISRRRLEFEELRDTILSVSGTMKRRTLYEPVTRRRLNQTQAMFDGPDPFNLVPERAETTTTPQALFLMNSSFVPTAAKTLARKIQASPKFKDDNARIVYAYRKLLGREPSEQEARFAQAFLKRSSLTEYLHVMMCTNEFVYLD